MKLTFPDSRSPAPPLDIGQELLDKEAITLVVAGEAVNQWIQDPTKTLGITAHFEVQGDNHPDAIERLATTTMVIGQARFRSGTNSKEVHAKTVMVGAERKKDVGRKVVGALLRRQLKPKFELTIIAHKHTT